MLNRREKSSLSHVPSVNSGTTGQTGTTSGTVEGQNTLKALALKHLQRDSARDKADKCLSHSPESNSPTVPPAPGAMPNDYELGKLCKHVAMDYPSVAADRLKKFISVSGDPEWATETNARNIARLMHEGLITLYEDLGR